MLLPVSVFEVASSVSRPVRFSARPKSMSLTRGEW